MLSRTTSGSIEQHNLIISEQRGTRFSLSLHPFSSPEQLDANKITKVFQSFNVKSKIMCTRLEPRLFKQHVEEDKKRKTTEQSTSTPTNAAALSQDGSSSGAMAQNLLICIPLDLKAECKIQRSFLRARHSTIKKHQTFRWKVRRGEMTHLSSSGERAKNTVGGRAHHFYV